MALVLVAPVAAAETFGQIGTPWGAQGTGHAQFYNPGAFGVDPETGDVYAGDLSADGSHFRIQKLTDTGGYLGAVEIERNAGGVPHTLIGFAVDPTTDRFYAVEACPVTVGTTTCSSSGTLAAINLLVFEADSTAEVLKPPQRFPLPAGEGEIYRPQAVAVDRGADEVLILGDEAAAHRVVQRIGASGLLGGRFVDTANQLKPSNSAGPGEASTLAVGPDGTAYTLSGGHPFTAGQAVRIRGWELPRDMSALKEIPGVAEAEASEQWENKLTLFPINDTLRGPSLAISPDGQTLYWGENLPPAVHEPAQIRGFSLVSHETTVIYGNGKTTCKIESSVSPAYGPGIGTFGESVVAFEYGPEVPKATNKVTFGRKVYLFGPGGTGCPSIVVKPPVAKFTIQGKEAGATAGEGEPVTFDASSSQLQGGYREELIWRFGDGIQAIVLCPGIGNGECEEPAKATVTHVYRQACTCKVELEMKLRNPRAGNPPVVSHSIKIEARPHFDLVVTKAGTGSGLISSNWPGILCGRVCEASFQEEKEVTLIPAAASGSVFAGWSGARECAGTTGLCRVTMSAAKAVTATFVPAPPPPAAATSVAVVAAGATTTATTAKPTTNKKVPAACRKLRGNARVKCIKRHNQQAKAKKAKKAKHTKRRGGGKETR